MLQLAQQFVSFWGFVPLAVWACKFHAQSRRAGGGKTGKLGYWTLLCVGSPINTFLVNQNAHKIKTLSNKIFDDYEVLF